MHCLNRCHKESDLLLRTIAREALLPLHVQYLKVSVLGHSAVRPLADDSGFPACSTAASSAAASRFRTLTSPRTAPVSSSCCPANSLKIPSSELCVTLRRAKTHVSLLNQFDCKATRFADEYSSTLSSSLAASTLPKTSAMRSTSPGLDESA